MEFAQTRHPLQLQNTSDKDNTKVIKKVSKNQQLLRQTRNFLIINERIPDQLNKKHLQNGDESDFGQLEKHLKIKWKIQQGIKWDIRRRINDRKKPGQPYQLHRRWDEGIFQTDFRRQATIHLRKGPKPQQLDDVVSQGLKIYWQSNILQYLIAIIYFHRNMIPIVCCSVSYYCNKCFLL